MESELAEKTLSELIEIATQKRLVDGWKYDNGTVHFQIGSVDVALRADSAMAFVRGLIRGYEKAQQLAEN